MRASSALEDRPAANAVDGLAETLWNAVEPAPAWIEIELGRERTVREIRLLVAQDPSGPSRHVISVRGADDDWREIGVLEGRTADGDWLTVELPKPIDGVGHVRVETTNLANGLWPAWYEISVLGR